jgi:four helix bundle protein
MAKFRFKDLEIWQMAIEIGDELFDIADELQEKKKYRFADQLYGAGLSFSNNIAEGSGSFSSKDFANFLNTARRSVFECANILVVLLRRSLVDKDDKEKLFNQLDTLSRMITNFRKNLLK